MNVQNVYFIPRYIGALKYYEKLFPAIRARGYEPVFLPFEDNGMCAYCRERHLPCDTRLLPTNSIHVPFITPFSRDIALRKLFESILETNPRTLVTEPYVSQQVRGLYRIARGRGIRTLALQWAQHPNHARKVSRSLWRRYLALSDRYGSLVGIFIRGTYHVLLQILFTTANVLSGGDTFQHKDFYTDCLGLIDENIAPYFERRGWTKQSMRVVGFADYTLMHERVQDYNLDREKRHHALRRLTLSSDKKIILLVSTPFYTGRDAVFLTRGGQRDYYLKIIDDIRAVYGRDEADIVLKLHPREDNLYGDLSAKGVKIVGNESDLDELIALADLYVAHPLTAANFIVKASATPAIFINFTPLPYLNDGKEIYRLRTIYTNHEDFRKILAQFKSGALPLQYDSSDVDPASLEKIVDFICAQ